MNRGTFNRLVEELYVEITELERAKGKDYSGDDDALSNFKRNAERFGQTPLQIWGVYAFKHIDAIASFVKNNGQLESEPIKERIKDAILYLFLLHGLNEEQTESASNVKYPRWDDETKTLWMKADTFYTGEDIQRQASLRRLGEKWEWPNEGPTESSSEA